MDDLEKKISEYQALGKENSNIDVASLMISALNSEKKNLVSSKQKKWAYLVSVGVPPFGFFFALKFYFGEEDDAKHVANICIILTCLSVLSFWLISKSLFSSTGTSM